MAAEYHVEEVRGSEMVGRHREKQHTAVLGREWEEFAVTAEEVRKLGELGELGEWKRIAGFEIGIGNDSAVEKELRAKPAPEHHVE